MGKKKKPKTRNPMAGVLGQRTFQPQTVPDKKKDFKEQDHKDEY